MPFSQSRQISVITAWLEATRPSSILDVGAGIGLYGLLARIYLESAELFEVESGNVRYRPHHLRRLRVEGIEGFAAYHNPIHDFIYDQLHIGDALTLLRKIPSGAFDSVLAIDILEHFTKADGAVLLRELIRVTRIGLLVSTPKIFTPQDIVANSLEHHRAHWSNNDLRSHGCRTFLPDPESWIAVWQNNDAAATVKIRPLPTIVKPADHAPGIIGELFVELTSNCNLRCRYCAVSLPDYVGRDMASRHVNAVLQYVEQHKAPLVNINVRGETTQVGNWVEICERLQAAGARINIISNFARYFSDAEVETLAGFAGIRISLDSVDRKLLRAIRRNVDLRIVLHNLTRVRAAALAVHGRMPQFGINCVVSDRNVSGVSDLVAFAAANGFNDLTLHDLAELAGLPEDSPKHITKMPPEKMRGAMRSMRDALQLAGRLGLHLSIQPNLALLLESGGEPPPALSDTQYFKHDAETLVLTPPLTPGTTRLCFDPWHVVKIAEDGSVMPCCIGKVRIGHLDDAPLDIIFQNEAMQNRRRELLNGNLSDECRTCPTRSAISTAEFRVKLGKSASKPT